MEKEFKKVKIGNKTIGEGEPVFVTAEIGINHNGDLNIAKKLIDAAVEAGCDAVKFQKRTIELVYTPEELARPRENPFGPTNGDLKRGLEFGEKEYEEIDRYCKQKGIIWFASPWDKKSVDFLEKFNVPCYKIPSACLTDDELLKYVKSKGKPIILSTGMSSVEQIKHAVEILGEDNLVVLHCTSTYPSDDKELNLNVIPWLKENFNSPIGYSGHEVGAYSSLAAAVLGACAIERHITLDRAMWGSDQAASLEINGLNRLVRDIRFVPVWLGDGEKRIYESEIPILQKLRKVKTIKKFMEKINNELKEHIEIVNRILDTQVEKIQEITDLITDCYKKGGKVILCGNGGSAADAQHIAAEFVGKYKLERKSLPAIALTANTSILTAIGNDYGFEKIFERQIENLVTERDVIIGISTSGNTVNVIKAILKAKEIGAKTVAFTGSSGGKLKDVADILLNIPSDNAPRIQEAHIMAGHIICGLVEENTCKD
jgi:N-acetylneuraminate synthase